jgi:hypothetical protein
MLSNIAKIIIYIIFIILDTRIHFIHRLTDRFVFMGGMTIFDEHNRISYLKYLYFINNIIG